MEYSATDEDVRIFREWLVKVPYLPHGIGDCMIKGFIQGCKGSLETAKKKFDNYHHLRLKMPEMFMGMDPTSKFVRHTFKTCELAISPNLTKDGSMVSFMRIKPDCPQDEHNVYWSYKTLQHVSLALLLCPDLMSQKVFGGKTCPSKTILVYDTRFSKIGHSRQYTPSVLSRLVENLTNATPLRLTGIHVINMTSVVEWIFLLFKSLLKPKLANRMQMYNLNEIFNYLPKDCIPSDFGGDLPPMNEMSDELQRVLELTAPAILEWEEQIKAVEHKRPKTEEDIAVGSFRKLQVD